MGYIWKRAALSTGISARRCGGDSAENYLRWLHCGGMDTESLPQTEAEVETALQARTSRTVPASLPASAALMTTNRCNMGCPVCFTRDKKEGLHEPDLAECEKLLRHYKAVAGDDAAVELCGGGAGRCARTSCSWRPLARDLGFGLIQLNTNGIKLAESEEYCP